MTNEASRVFRFLRFVIPSSFVIRASSFSGSRNALRKKLWILHGTRHSSSSFTLLELLVVIAIIITLAGLILATVGYVQKKAARSRAEAEIAAISAALESYKADNGIYPSSADTNALDPIMDVNPVPPPPANRYSKAGLYLYEQISGDTNDDRVAEQKTYFAFKPSMLFPSPPATLSVLGIRDPFGNCYGYSTAKASNPGGTAGYNPTFDLWSTAGTTSGTTTDVAQWIKNW